MNALAYVADHALCAQVDLELFFPEKGGSSRDAIEICQRCPVREQCLQVALELGVHGVWGGTSGKQRRQLGGKEPGVWYEPAQHGTEAAERRHYRRGELPCAICRDASYGRRAAG